MSHYTLDTSSSGIISTLIFQGVAFSCLWVPLTTVALSTIPRHKMADATGSNSLVRQIGGSVGLAIFATLLTRTEVNARSGLLAHMNPGRPEVVSRLAMTRQMMAGRGGLDATTARDASRRMLEFIVDRQAMVLSFEKMFLLAGILFAAVLPLLFFLKSPKNVGQKIEKVDAHVEI
jgi:DHA2 family multidrug resistance protein